jgi:hypothetical protein
MGHPLWWEDESVIYLYKCYWATVMLTSTFCGNWDHILLLHLRLDSFFCHLLRLTGLQWKYSNPPTKAKSCYDQQSVGQSVLVSDLHLEPVTNFSFVPLEIILIFAVFQYGMPSLTRTLACNLCLLLGLTSAACLGSESHTTHDHTLLSQLLDSPQLEGVATRFYSGHVFLIKLLGGPNKKQAHPIVARCVIAIGLHIVGEFSIHVHGNASNFPLPSSECFTNLAGLCYSMY